MKSVVNLRTEPAGLPVVADDILEFHASRLILLLHLCGIGGRVTGLTKIAKLDFFVRYPQFFDEVCRVLDHDVPQSVLPVESSMIRFHYGPWDKRYYHVLAYLKAKNLVQICKTGNAYVFSLTAQGKDVAAQLKTKGSYRDLVEHMKSVKNLLGHRTGSSLKDLVYRVFDKEVGERRLGEVIR